MSGPSLGSGEMFDAIASRYDTLNRVLSLGLDQGWRRQAVRAMEVKPDDVVLDLATGTGDMALLLARAHADATVIGVDPSRGMLEVAARKARRAGARVDFRVGDAQRIELDDASVSSICMAFGIRNVPERLCALREMARVTKPGGRVALLELSEPRSGAFGRLARLYVHEIVPRVGAAVSGRCEYAYLQRSIAAFPPPEEFAALMEEAGLEVLEATPLTFGVACLFVATPRSVRPAEAA